MIFLNEKKIEKDSDNFWHRKLTLKVRNWQFSITWFRKEVDLPKIFFYEKVLFFTRLSYHLMCKLLKKSYMLSNKYNCSKIIWLCFSHLEPAMAFMPPLLKTKNLVSYLKKTFFIIFPLCPQKLEKNWKKLWGHLGF